MFMPYIIFEYHQSPQEDLQQENIMHTRIRQAAQCKFQVWVDLEEGKKKRCTVTKLQHIYYLYSIHSGLNMFHFLTSPAMYFVGTS